MRPITAYRNGLGALRSSPALAGLIALFTIVNTIAGAVPMAIMAVLERPFVGQLSSFALFPIYLIVAPAVLGGVFAMAWRALDGRADLDAFVSGARSNYLQLLGWTVVIAAIEFVVTIVTFFVMWLVAIVLIIVVAGAGAAVFGDPTGSGAAMAGLSIAVVLVIALVVLVTMIITLTPYAIAQFIPGAVVFEEHSFIEAGKRGLGLLRRNLLVTFGFDLTVLAVGLVSMIGTFAFVALVTDPGSMSAVGTASVETGQYVNPYAGWGALEMGGFVGISAILSTISACLVMPAYAAFFRILTSA